MDAEDIKLESKKIWAESQIKYRIWQLHNLCRFV
jgi:hypothetical protein